MEKTHDDLRASLLLLVILIAASVLLKIFLPSAFVSIIITYILTIILTIIILIGIIIIGNNPTSIGVVTKWGERLWKEDSAGNPIIVYLTEGWNWLFLRWIVYDVILISMIKREHDFPIITLITPDNGTTDTGRSFAYIPSKVHAINYLNLGNNQKARDAMVIEWFENILDSELRQWAMDPTNGPKTWEELIAGKDETVKMLMGKIVGRVLSDDELRNVIAGRSNILVETMGIEIIRLNLTTMTPFGPVYEASVAKDTEKKERASEVYEVGTDLQKAKLLQKELKKQNVNLSLSDCMERIMKWKVAREGNKQLSLSAITKNIVDAIKS